MKINDHAPVLPYQASSQRYDSMPYRRVGNSGVQFPALSLGLWHNFGEHDNFSNARAMLRTAFDLGITHFDLANNYGPPYGSAESNFGRIMTMDFAQHRDELFISSKAGYDMWPGPYGVGGSRKYLISSLDQSLKRMGLDYVDLFYHHCPDDETPIEETVGALDSLVRQGKALYVGISNYSAEQTRQALKLFNELGTPCLIHQVRYSMFDRAAEHQLMPLLDDKGVGLITFSPLAQGLLSDRYLNGIPTDSRAANSKSYLQQDSVSEHLRQIKQLHHLAQQRGQSLSQMALAWILEKPEVSSVLIGASSAQQLIDNVQAVDNLSFSGQELQTIEQILSQ
ncbi:aldo/keto reductase [Agarivorans gilvus]|uniref:Glyceraldehyde 3-phosphate reductase n=1 Tax=Agarivorans gilvus TaxID=680279 RepID=A0ABQ1I131_9ALTE|nr:aldo/keto reductase [Agarivorans gilvus]GGB01415.1 glyceraldehyde 3-phosphate reductase [Agarivorans gilvus]